MKFENRYYTNKEIYKEFVNKVATRKIMFSCLILFVISIVLLVLFRDNSFYVAIYLVIALFSLVMIIMIQPMYLKQLLEMDFKLHNGERPETIVIFDDKITLKEGKQQISIEYSQIKKYYRLKRSSILMFSEQNGVMFVEDNFTIGNKEEFEKFILEKCENLEKVIEK